MLFLESNWASFLSICEDRPDKAWRRSLICVSMDIAKFFVLPCGKSLSPFKSDSLKSYVEEILGSLCIGLKAFYSDEVSVPFSRILLSIQVATSPFPLPRVEALLT